MRVLIVDDSPNIRQIIKEILAIEGWPTAEAANGGEAVRVCRQFHPDVVLMDVDMPGLDGIDAARVIRRANPDVQVVMVTARGERATVAEAYDVGIAGFLVKPFEPHRLLDLLRFIRSRVTN